MNSKTFLLLPALICIIVVFASCSDADTVGTNIPLKSDNEFLGGDIFSSLDFSDAEGIDVFANAAELLDAFISGSIIGFECSYFTTYTGHTSYEYTKRFIFNEKLSTPQKSVYDAVMMPCDGNTYLYWYSIQEFEKTSDGVIRTIFQPIIPFHLAPDATTEYRKWRVNLLEIRNGKVYEIVGWGGPWYDMPPPHDPKRLPADTYQRNADNSISVIYFCGFDNIQRSPRTTLLDIKVIRR